MPPPVTARIPWPLMVPPAVTVRPFVSRMPCSRPREMALDHWRSFSARMVPERPSMLIRAFPAEASCPSSRTAPSCRLTCRKK
ncbi:MAG: hypothetical protein ACLSCR_09460 [Akkermansia sp.]